MIKKLFIPGLFVLLLISLFSFHCQKEEPRFYIPDSLRFKANTGDIAIFKGVKDSLVVYDTFYIEVYTSWFTYYQRIVWGDDKELGQAEKITLHYSGKYFDISITETYHQYDIYIKKQLIMYMKDKRIGYECSTRNCDELWENTITYFKTENACYTDVLYTEFCAACDYFTDIYRSIDFGLLGYTTYDNWRYYLYQYIPTKNKSYEIPDINIDYSAFDDTKF